MSDKRDAENPEWTADDFAQAKPASDLPEALQAAFPKTRGVQKAPTKVPVSIRLSPDVVAHYRATGKGWQARLDEDLKRVIERR